MGSAALGLCQGRAAYESPNPSYDGRASASVNTASPERLAPRDPAADAVTPAYRPATAADFHPTYSIRTSMAVPSMWWLAAPPTRKECNVYCLFSIPAARRLVWRFAVICAGVNARFPFYPLSRTLGNKKLEPSTRAHCMDAAACWYSIIAATAQISRQSVFLLTTTA